MTRGSKSARRTGAVRIDSGLIFDAAIGNVCSRITKYGVQEVEDDQRQKARILKSGSRSNFRQQIIEQGIHGRGLFPHRWGEVRYQEVAIDEGRGSCLPRI